MLGWNTRDPFEAMEPTDAVLLDNWYPDFGGVAVRNGSTPYARGLGTGAVETLGTFTTSTINQFLAACGGAVYNISSTTPILLSSGFLSDRWQTTEFNGHFFFVDGADPAQIYDGTTLSAASFTGVSTATLAGVSVIHQRLFFWTGRDPSFWYGPVNGISGALVNFPLDMESQGGGNLIDVETFSYDGGQGIASYTAFFMSSGELFLYSGSDPSNANNWALVGRYVVPPLITTRAITRYGGDIYLATVNDHQQLSIYLAALKAGEVPPRTKISGAAKAAFDAGGSRFGWQAFFYPQGRRVIFNIPNPDGTFSQHIYNTSLQTWTRFRDMNAFCWGIYNNNLYYGAAGGNVIQADTGSMDSALTQAPIGPIWGTSLWKNFNWISSFTPGGTAPVPITASSQQAWNIFGSAFGKRLTASRVVVETLNQSASYNFDVGYDYNFPQQVTPAALSPMGAIWGTFNWNAANWSQAMVTVDSNWHVEGGDGSAISWGIVGNFSAPARWVRTDLLIEPGTML